MRFRSIAMGLLGCLLAADVSAQTCLGLPSFSEGPFQASGGAAFTDGAQSYGGGIALGSDNYFGGVGLTFTNVDDVDSTATTVSFNLGASYPLSQQERIEVCPVAAINVTTGPDVGEADISGVGLRGGGRLGLLAAQTGNIDIVPTFGLDVAYDRVTADVGGVDTSVSETYTIVRVGVGLIFNKRIGIVPTLGVPLGLEGSDPEFSILAAFTFGGR